MLIPHGALILVVDDLHLRLLRNRGTISAPVLHTLHERAPKSPPQASAPHKRREHGFGRAAMDLVASTAGDDVPVIAIVPPHMLDEMPTDSDPLTQRHVVADIDRGVAQRSPDEILELLRTH